MLVGHNGRSRGEDGPSTMTFPETRFSLIQRLAAGGSEDDWRHFLQDYSGPIRRFALRRGARNVAEADEVVTQTFETLWEAKLLVRWVANRTAKLRTLLCAVAWRIVASRLRKDTHHQRAIRQWAEQADTPESLAADQADLFYRAWAEDLLQRSVELVARDYYRSNQGDHVRVLYSRLCEGLSVAETARLLELDNSQVVSYYRQTRQRLSERIRQLLRNHIVRYCPAEEVQSEFDEEWRRLADHLERHGGLDEAVRMAYEAWNPIRSADEAHANAFRRSDALNISTPITDGPVAT